MPARGVTLGNPLRPRLRVGMATFADTFRRSVRPPSPLWSWSYAAPGA